MSLFKKRFPTLEEQISRLSPKCRELTEEESRLLNGGGPSVWDTYNGSGCPYEYTTVPKDPPAETTTPASNTPDSKTSEILESTATDTSNQTPEQETGNATSSPTSISTPVSQTPIADYVRKVVNTAFELQKKNFGKEYIEMDYQGQHILVARAGNAKSIEQAAQYYFTTGKDGVIGNKVVDTIAIADENGNIIHKFSNDDAIRAYELELNPGRGSLSHSQWMDVSKNLNNISKNLDTLIKELDSSNGNIENVSETIKDSAKQYLSKDFGSQIEDIQNLSNNLTSIKNEIDSLERNDFKSNIDSNIYAWTYPFVSKKITLGSMYFNAKQSGDYDSQEGTILHEVTHHFSVLGTFDITYNNKKMIELNDSGLISKSRNANNWEYFYEKIFN